MVAQFSMVNIIWSPSEHEVRGAKRDHLYVQYDMNVESCVFISPYIAC